LDGFYLPRCGIGKGGVYPRPNAGGHEALPYKTKELLLDGFYIPRCGIGKLGGGVVFPARISWSLFMMVAIRSDSIL
jgi:hypothetical protein